MAKFNCSNCANALSKDYCTRLLDMDKATYQKCLGWKDNSKVIINVKNNKLSSEVEDNRNERELRLMDNIKVSSKFQKFIIKGGGYSFRTKEYLCV